MKKPVLLFLVALLACYHLYSQQINWQWARGATGSGEQEGWACATDKSGNVYVTGSFTGDSITFDNTTFYYHPSLSNSFVVNLFVVKYSPSGDLLWAQCPLVPDTDGIVGFGITTDMDNNVFVTGSYSGGGIFFDGNHLAPTLNGMQGVFVVKYDSTGKALWAKGAGGIWQDYGNGIATDNDGDVLVTGYFDSDSIKFGASVLHRIGLVGTYNSFVAKYDPDGRVLWAQCPEVTGSTFVQGTGVVADENGDVYTTGSFQGSSVTFGSYTLQPSSSGAVNVYVVKLNSVGNILWAKQSGGHGDLVNAIAADSSSNVIITGIFSSDNTYFDGVQLTNKSSAGGDYFITKYDPSGNVLWAHNSNGCYECSGYCLAVNKCGNIYLGGGFEINANHLAISIADTTISMDQSSTDPLFIVSYNSSGQALNAATLPSGGDDVFGIALDQSGNAYIGNDFESNELVVGPDTLTLTGDENIYVAKFNCPVCSITGVNDLAEDASVMLYPNPCSVASVRLAVTSELIGSQLEIYDDEGRLVFQSEIRTLKSEIAISDLPSGVYFMRISSADAAITKKLVKL